MKNLLRLFNVCAFLALISCEEKSAKTSAPQQSSSSQSLSSLQSQSASPGYAGTDQWIGEWRGPEGTFLKIAGNAGKYEIIIQDLDGPKSYSGVSVDNAIQFQRDGILEKIHATNGEETGMKWLSKKHNCLTIKRGEGFCRD